MANLISQLVSDCSVDLSSLEDMVPEMFLAVSNGLHLSLVMEMFISSKTFKQLTQLMTNIFSHGVQTDQMEIY